MSISLFMLLCWHWPFLAFSPSFSWQRLRGQTMPEKIKENATASTIAALRKVYKVYSHNQKNPNLKNFPFPQVLTLARLFPRFGFLLSLFNFPTIFFFTGVLFLYFCITFFRSCVISSFLPHSYVMVSFPLVSISGVYIPLSVLLKSSTFKAISFSSASPIILSACFSLFPSFPQ